MTKKLFRRMAWVALPTLLAGSAFSQVVPVIPSGRINPILGLPKSLPSPLTGPLAGAVTNLPSVAIPTISLPTAMPALPAAAIVTLPSAAPVAVRVNLPAPARVKVVIANLSAAAEKLPAGDKKSAAAEKKAAGDELFDGKGRLPKDEPEAPRAGRHVSLPESDLLDEIGI